MLSAFFSRFSTLRDPSVLVKDQSHFSLKKNFPLYYFSGSQLILFQFVYIHFFFMSDPHLFRITLDSASNLLCMLSMYVKTTFLIWSAEFFFTSSLPLFTFFLTRPVYCPWRGPGKTNVKIFV